MSQNLSMLEMARKMGEAFGAQTLHGFGEFDRYPMGLLEFTIEAEICRFNPGVAPIKHPLEGHHCLSLLILPTSRKRSVALVIPFGTSGAPQPLLSFFERVDQLKARATAQPEKRGLIGKIWDLMQGCTTLGRQKVYVGQIADPFFTIALQETKHGLRLYIRSSLRIGDDRQMIYLPWNTYERLKTLVEDWAEQFPSSDTSSAP